MLARQILHFTRDQVIWECRGFAASESFPRGLPSHLQQLHDKRYLNPFHWLGPHHLAAKQFAIGWAELLRRYARGQLSFPSDKLIAISGLMSTALNTSGGPYLAGMWQCQLPVSLPWVREDVDERLYLDRRKLGNLAPSWSWASFDCPVHTEWTKLSQDDVQKVLATVLECHDANTTSNSDLQASKRLSLVITAPTGKITWDRKKPWTERINERESYCVARLDSWLTGQEPFLGDLTKSTVPDYRLQQQIESNIWNDVIFDALEEDHPPSTLRCLPVFIGRRSRFGQNYPERSVFGLVLDEVGGKSYGNEIMRRVGVFTVGYPEGRFFELLPMRTVTLV